LTFRGAFLFGAIFGLVVGFVVAAYVAGSHAQARAADCAALSGEAQLQCVTRATNKQIKLTDDLVHYGVEDVWVEDPVDGKGDCEDYVLTKARALEKLGWSTERMRMAIFQHGQKTHAVLLIDDTYVLDNMSPWVGRWKDYGPSLRGIQGSYPIEMARSLLHFSPLLLTASADPP
jgi:predicted transglutaminase-like cysteine proteinase